MTQRNLTVPARRLIAAGFVRRLPGRTLTVRATQAGVTGTITPTAGPVCCGRPMAPQDGQLVCSKCGAWIDPGAARVAELHRLARQDYASSTDRRIQDRRDDVHLIATASDAVAAR